ncbi:hypothetical protein ACX80E_02270 [Arthrobacter sp. TMN-49]
MTLRPAPENSAADWITGTTLPWQQLVGFGPAGFPAYARLRILPDPTRPGQSENDAEAIPGVLPETDMMQAAIVSLSKHTATAGGLYFCFWDGSGFDMPGAWVDVPNRSYYLYEGSVSENGAWEIATEDQAPDQQWIPTPALVWPADRAWCVAKDVDPHWVGIGASTDAINELIADPRLDAVSADPAEWPPQYY